jgi:glycosyltransferase involved in cell wall biosynthesis
VEINRPSVNSGTLVLLTHSFPFGYGEAFLETEVKYLAKFFKSILIIPSNFDGNHTRLIPDNVTVLSDVAKTNGNFKLIKLLFYSRYFLEVYLFSILNSGKRFNYLRYIKSMMHYFYMDCYKIGPLNTVIEKFNLSKAVFYDYWMINSSLALIYLSKKFDFQKIVCRSHGFDLYDERHMEGVVPFKEFKINHLDSVITISRHGQDYLKSRMINTQKEVIKNYNLGVEKPRKYPKTSSEKIIVSCSNLLEFKQVDRLALAVLNMTNPVKWVHFGGGQELEKIEKIVAMLPVHIQVDLRGKVSNKTIIDYYIHNYISAFVSLSRSEGLPVSMMEAQAFGIPIISPGINGIPEIVNSETGFLLRCDFSDDEVTQSLEKMLYGNRKFDRRIIKRNFDENFNSGVNYPKFIREVLLDQSV